MNIQNISRKIATSAAAAAALVLLTPTAGQAASSESTYIHLVNRNSGRCLEIDDNSGEAGARVQQWACLGQEASQWHLHPSGPDGHQVQIRSRRHPDMCLEVAHGGTRNGARVQTWGCVDGAAEQQWVIGDGVIRNHATGKALEIADSDTEDGARAQQWEYEGADTQIWYVD
ncbi:RICIN domain-containing protein [Streptomyces sp. NPDC046876]|uniref:RICIN domain-containing protein n=1 Tax=Streptomyces sp. NPDC046876 TaxID=3155616 RepID=UPI0033DEA8DB